MPDAPRFRIMLICAMVATAGWCGWIFAGRYLSTGAWERRIQSRPDARAAEFERTYGGSGVKILNFYARDPAALEDSGTLLCYSVINAKSVRIEPAVEGVWPSLSRCVAIAPEKDTRYTLTAEGDNGRAVTASFLLPVRPDPEKQVKISKFKVEGRDTVEGRARYTLSFWVENAEEVSFDPPLLSPSRLRFGRVSVSPIKPTTYTLTATDKRGRKAQRQLTIDPSR
jgi:hypothetical protein